MPRTRSRPRSSALAINRDGGAKAGTASTPRWPRGRTWQYSPKRAPRWSARSAVWASPAPSGASPGLTHDLAPILASLPAGHCTCPHWGYVLKGKITIRYSDHEETVTAGEAFYMPPGHAPAAEVGTELIQFSPADQLAEVEQAIMAATQPGSAP